MPPGMPSNVSKGYIINRLEHCLNYKPSATQPYTAREDLLQKLLGTDRLLDIARDLKDPADTTKFLLRSKDKAHLEKHWFTTKFNGADDTCFWPEHKPLDIVIRQGLIQAIMIADTIKPDHDPYSGPGQKLGTPKDMSLYWVCSGHHFEVVICDSKPNAQPGNDQVVVLILTPSLPDSSRIPERFQDWSGWEDIFTVRHCSMGPGEKKLRERSHVEVAHARAEV